MSEYQIQRLQPEHWYRLRAVRLRALADSPNAFGTLLAEDEARSAHDWRRRLEREEVVTLVAFTAAHEDVGLVVATPWKWSEDNDAAGLFAMWVAPETRGTGVGGALIDAVIAWAREGNYARILLDVADQNTAAVALYASRGFVPTGKTGTLPPPRHHVTEHERELVLGQGC